MSDYRDVIKKAIREGWYLDSCGSDERYYSWGSFMDLCGMSVEEAMSGFDDGSSDNIAKNNIVLLMRKDTEGEYSLYVTASQEPASDVNVSFVMDDEPKEVVLPAGVTSVNTGLKGTKPIKPYAKITNIAVDTEDETYIYTTKNNVKTGMFLLTIIEDGETVREESVMYGTEIELPEVVEKTGYDFVRKDGDGEIITGATINMPEANLTITGVYMAKSYTLTYIIKQENLNDGEIVTETISGKTVTVKYNESVWNVIKNTALPKTGFSLEGWSSEGGVVNSSTKMPADNFEVFNTYKRNKYTLKYVANNDILINVEKFYEESIGEYPEIPEKTGYTIIGWDTGIPVTMPASDLTVNAVYEAIIYHITYFVDGDEKYSEEHIYDDSISIRANEVKEGYTFSGWDTELPATMPAEDIVINGSFTINSYTLTFLSDGGAYTSITANYGTAVPEIVDPEKEGYTFSGWDTELPATMPATDMTFNAGFQINQYNINYILDDEPYTSVTYDYNAVVEQIAAPKEKEGYTFSGWGEVPERMPAHNIDITGQFNINSYVIIYFVDNELYESAVTEYNAVITPAEAPAAPEGYTFSGWDVVHERMPANDVEVHGTFNINYHTISYFIDGASAYSETLAYGTEITPQDAPEQVGYTFSGWTEIPQTMPDNDVRVDGWFNINQYTLTFIVDGESEIPYTSITADYETQVPEIEEPSKVGYTFSGWDKKIPETIPAEDMVFNGTLDINHWIAEYLIDGNLYTSVTLSYGETIVYPDVPREGYDLIWNKEYETMPNSNLTINGEYVEHPVSNTVYYGMVRMADNKTVDTYQSLSSYEYEDGASAEKIFIIGGDPRYLELETDEDFDNWDINENQGFCLIVPDGVTFTILNDFNNNLTPGFTLGATGTIDGNDYNAYYMSADTAPIDTSISYRMFITVEKQ